MRAKPINAAIYKSQKPGSTAPESYRKYVEDLAKQGWDWICFHFKDWSWQISPNNLLAGDCLYKYVEATFAALCSGYRD